MRSIGVVAIRMTPEVDLRDFPPGKGGTAAKGAAMGAAVGIVAGAVITVTSCLFAPACPAAAAAFAGSTAFGGVAGANVADPAEKIKAAHDELKAVVAGAKFQDILGTRVVDYASVNAISGFAVSRLSPASFEDRPNYLPVAEKEGDTILEIAVQKLTLRSTGIIDIRFTLEMTARARLVRVSDSKIISDQTYFYGSETRKLAEWAEEEGRPFRQAFGEGFQTLAEYIVDEAFLLADSSLPPRKPSHVRPLRFRYSLYPEYPSSEYPFIFVPIDSLQPTLRWESPDWLALDSGGAALPVPRTYELRLFRARAVTTFVFDDDPVLPVTSYPTHWIPGELIYRIKDIPVPSFRLEFPLAPCTEYFWTVRARWQRNARSTVTEWAGVYVLPPWTLRRKQPGHYSSLNPYEGLSAPRSYYLPFKTPCDPAAKQKK